MLLLETVFGPVWVYAAGYEAPATLTAAGIGVIVVCLLFNGILTIRAANKVRTVFPPAFNHLDHLEMTLMRSTRVLP